MWKKKFRKLGKATASATIKGVKMADQGLTKYNAWAEDQRTKKITKLQRDIEVAKLEAQKARLQAQATKHKKKNPFELF